MDTLHALAYSALFQAFSPSAQVKATAAVPQVSERTETKKKNVFDLKIFAHGCRRLLILILIPLLILLGRDVWPETLSRFDLFLRTSITFSNILIISVDLASIAFI